jgi:thiol-disulfide isomerase/thioredoxin
MAFSYRTALVAAVLWGAAAISEASAAPATGQPAPPLRLTTIDGKTVDLASYRGKTLVINVWGSWCPPCRLETPDLIAEAAAMSGAKVAFLGVDTTETSAVVRAYAAAKGMTYPQVATTGESAFARDYAITNYPTTIVIDPNGVLRAIHADNILPRAQLHAYILGAQKGETAPLVTVEQQKLDAMLELAKFPFDGDPASVLASVRAADSAIAAADEELDDAMIDPARDHDLLRTRAEQDTLRNRAIAALQANAQTPKDRVLLARLQGDAAESGGSLRRCRNGFPRGRLRSTRRVPRRCPGSRTRSRNPVIVPRSSQSPPGSPRFRHRTRVRFRSHAPRPASAITTRRSRRSTLRSRWRRRSRRRRWPGPICTPGVPP